MKKLVLILASALLFISVEAQETISIACLGDEVTSGQGIENRAKNGYPGQLQQLLGDRYEVYNFGVNGAVVLTEFYSEYRRSAEYINLAEYAPNTILICLGTNDVGARYKSGIDNYATDLEGIINELKFNFPTARLVVLTPPKIILRAEDDKLLKEKVIPMIQRVAKDKNIEIIDLYPLFSVENNADLCDKLSFPTKKGASLIAKKVYEQIK